MGVVVGSGAEQQLVLRLRELRGNRTLTEVAELAGMRQDELGRIERGETKSISFETLIKLCEAFHATPGQLFAVESTSKQQTPLESVLAALAANPALAHVPPPRRRLYPESAYTMDLSEAAVVMERVEEVPHPRRRKPVPAADSSR